MTTPAMCRKFLMLCRRTDQATEFCLRTVTLGLPIPPQPRVQLFDIAASGDNCRADIARINSRLF
jgi:hypothetical protein